MKNNIVSGKKNPASVIALFCACFIFTVCFCTFMPVNGEQQIYGDIIRLHVLANSDNQKDQDLKLEVRDYILGDIAAITKDCGDSAEAAAKINAALSDIETNAKDFVKQKGYDYNVTAVLMREIYPERTYEDYAGGRFYFPSGRYNSLKIIIGGGEGENWWCVLFPPICLSGSKIEDELAVAGYSSEQINILKRDKSGKYIIRFKILEILSDLFR
ncbi:MAG: stage II sporulation protein R [Oscillospiraceae bacterium]|nr:stage II sporulation protein R [Oscillospiraceae bacterium]